MVICNSKHNVYYPTPDKGGGLICGSRRIRFYRRVLLVSVKQPALPRFFTLAIIR